MGTKQDLAIVTGRLVEVESARQALVLVNQRVLEQNTLLEAGLKKMREVQELIVDDIMSVRAKQEEYVGNDYRDYGQAVTAIAEKYNGEAAWGCLQTGTCVDLRAAFILGDGIKIVAKTDTKEQATAELEFCKDFLEYNSLDGEMAQEMAKETEIEGKLLVKLFWDADPYRGRPGMPSARFVSWSDKHYTVEADKNDYLHYTKVTWKAGDGYEAGGAEEKDFVYAKFGGRISSPNKAQPKVMKCLTQIDRLDKALRDLREIDHLYASPTPDFECETAQQAANLMAFLKDKNWRIGKAIAHVGKLTMVGVPAEGIAALISEIELNTKMISGTTGIPIHYLGLLDLLKNRATGDNTRELVMAATTKERTVWRAAIQELIEKAMDMYNAQTGQAQKSVKLDASKVRVEIPLISQDHWKNLELVLIPAAVAGILSKEFVAEQIPGVDLELEAKRQKKAQEEADAQADKELERIRSSQGEAGLRAAAGQAGRESQARGAVQ